MLRSVTEKGWQVVAKCTPSRVAAVKIEATIIRCWAFPNTEEIQHNTIPSQFRGVNLPSVLRGAVGVREAGTRKTRQAVDAIRKQSNEEELVKCPGGGRRREGRIRRDHSEFRVE